MKRLLLAAIVLVLAAGCSHPPVAEAEIALYDGSIETSSSNLIAGEVALELENFGESDHTLVITKDYGEVVFATNAIPPGTTIDVDVDLEAGAYQFTCRIVAEGEGGVIYDHYQMGMVTDVAVTATG